MVNAMSKEKPKTFIVVKVKRATNEMLGPEWKREIKLNEGNFVPFQEKRKGKDLPSSDPKENRERPDYYDEVYTIAGHNPFSFTIKITPPADCPFYWEEEGSFKYNGKGKGVSRITAPSSTFHLDYVSESDMDNDTIWLRVYVSYLRERTESGANNALKSLNEYCLDNSVVFDSLMCNEEKKTCYVTKWPCQKHPQSVIDPLPDGVHFIATEPIPGPNTRINVDSIKSFNQAGIPDTTEVVFELKENTVAPRVISVSWPNSIDISKPVPILVYLHPLNGQNRPFYEGAPYPWGSKYIYACLWRSLVIRTDPFLQRSKYFPSLGLPYQVHVSGKKVPVICPVNRLGPVGKGQVEEYGILNNPKYMAWILYEIISFIKRKKGRYEYALLGKVALASYSYSYPVIVDFLKNNPNSEFIKRNLSEIYFFDPPVRTDIPESSPKCSVTECVNAVQNWIKDNPQNRKRIRLYRQQFHTKMAELVGQQGLSGNKSALYHSNDGLRTSGLFTIRDWKEVAEYSILQRKPGEKVVKEGGVVFTGETQLDLTACLGGSSSGKVRLNGPGGEEIEIKDAKKTNITRKFQEGTYHDSGAPNRICFRVYKRINWGYFDCHPLFPSMLLTDALRRSDLEGHP